MPWRLPCSIRKVRREGRAARAFGCVPSASLHVQWQDGWIVCSNPGYDTNGWLVSQLRLASVEVLRHGP